LPRPLGRILAGAGKSVKQGILGTVPKPQFWLVVVFAVAVLAGGSALMLSVYPLASPAPPAADVLYWSNEGVSDLASLDPAQEGDFNTRLVTNLIFGGLVRLGPRFRLLPDCASSWTISGDGRVFTFHLRPNVRFADGSVLTARDVAYSLNRTLSPQFRDFSGHVLLNDIQGAATVTSGASRHASGIRILDAQTIQIRLVRPSSSFLPRLATPAGNIVPPQAVAASPGEWSNHAFGTGPFMVDRWVHGYALLLAPNPYYYAGRPRLTGIDMQFVPEPLAAYKLYRAGAVDIMGSIQFPTSEVFSVRGEPDFHRSPRLETIYLTLNERRAPWNNLLVRRAFAESIDRHALARVVFHGFARPASGMLPPIMAGFSPLAGLPYDPTMARRLLARAGFPKGRGLPTIQYMSDQDSQSLTLADFLVSQWRQNLGVKVRLVQRGHAAYDAQLSALNFEIAAIDWSDDHPDPADFLSQTLQTGTPNNNGGWSSTQFDVLTTRAGAIDTPSGAHERARLYQAADALAMSQAATIPLVYPYSGIMLRSSVRGLSVTGGQVMARNWSRVTAGAAN
jgi:ABC-type transport system substrate-binding protein